MTAHRIKYGGRKKGSLNKTTALAKDAIASAAAGLGGAARLQEWATEDPANERVFWGTIYPKLLPLQLTGEGGGPVLTGDVSTPDRARALAAFVAKTRASEGK